MDWIFTSLKKLQKHGCNFLSEERTSKKGTDPLFWNRYESAKDTNSIFFASYKCSDMHKCKMLKLPNVSKIVNPIFYKSKQYTKVLFNKMFFFQRMGASA